MAANKNITAITVRSFVKRNEGKVFIKKTAEFDGMTDCVEQVSDNWHKAEYCLNIRRGIGLQGVYIIDGRTYYYAYEDSEFVGYRYSNCVERGIIAVKRSELVTKEDKKVKVSAPVTGSKQDKLEKATRITIAEREGRVYAKVDRTFYEFVNGTFRLVSVDRSSQNHYAAMFQKGVSADVASFADASKACAYLKIHKTAEAEGNKTKAAEFLALYFNLVDSSK